MTNSPAESFYGAGKSVFLKSPPLWSTTTAITKLSNSMPNRDAFVSFPYEWGLMYKDETITQQIALILMIYLM